MGRMGRSRTRALVALTGLGLVATLGGGVASASPVATPAGHANACGLGNGIKHVISIQFDNVHLSRDNPNVPSDLEQMPNLLHFLTGNGTVLSNAHDVLSHTATNFTSNQTGLYPDRTDITQSNSFSYYDPAGKTHTGVSFAYWTDPLYDPSGASIDPRYNMAYSPDRNANPIPANLNTPAPWVPYTRAGCDVGEVGMSNTVLENIATDIPTVFGANSPQAAEAKADPAKATADFVGFAVHCAKTSANCANGAGQTDALPDEPGGYNGYRALFGNAEVRPAISPDKPVANLDGQPITDNLGNPGFPGFDSLTADNSLGYAAALEEHHVPVVNVYLSDVHGDHANPSVGDLGPGTQVYEQQLHDYDRAFGQFLARLRGDGINQSNTLFSVTTDEGDHFSGSPAQPTGCTGAAGNYCTYQTSSEVNVNLPGLLATQRGDTTPFAIHSDPAPALWVQGNPAASSPAVRTLGRDLTSLTVTNPLTGGTDKIAYQIADPVEEKILHFVGPDAARTPTLTLFSGEDDYLGSGAQNCAKPCVYTSAGYAWNHGGIWPDMQNIWQAYVGPGIAHRGVDSSTWADQTDTRPTLLALAGLRDDYTGDGRVLVDDLTPWAVPGALRWDVRDAERLGAAYKQLMGADGQFAVSTLTASTKGIAGDDSTYTAMESKLTALDDRRNHLADRIQRALTGAEFGHTPIGPQAGELTEQANRLLADAAAL
jgi:hypothetical protein